MAFAVDCGRMTRYSDRAQEGFGRSLACGVWRPQVMKRKPSRKEKRRSAKAILRLPDLEAAKSAVLNSLSCPDAKRGYRHAIDEFVEWYCSEPRLSFSKTVNKLGMAVDVSHCGDRTTLDTFEASQKPVLVTHSNCRALVPNRRRCKTDEV